VNPLQGDDDHVTWVKVLLALGLVVLFVGTCVGCLAWLSGLG
jgi:hypothetical protein